MVHSAVKNALIARACVRVPAKSRDLDDTCKLLRFLSSISIGLPHLRSPDAPRGEPLKSRRLSDLDGFLPDNGRIRRAVVKQHCPLMLCKSQVEPLARSHAGTRLCEFRQP
jgi:hypothetical protein